VVRDAVLHGEVEVEQSLVVHDAVLHGEVVEVEQSLEDHDEEVEVEKIWVDLCEVAVGLQSLLVLDVTAVELEMDSHVGVAELHVAAVEMGLQ
jgi:hypothetical protein